MRGRERENECVCERQSKREIIFLVLVLFFITFLNYFYMGYSTGEKLTSWEKCTFVR